jgi:hypothetical protein
MRASAACLAVTLHHIGSKNGSQVVIQDGVL